MYTPIPIYRYIAFHWGVHYVFALLLNPLNTYHQHGWNASHCVAHTSRWWIWIIIIIVMMATIMLHIVLKVHSIDANALSTDWCCSSRIRRLSLHVQHPHGGVLDASSLRCVMCHVFSLIILRLQTGCRCPVVQPTSQQQHANITRWRPVHTNSVSSLRNIEIRAANMAERERDWDESMHENLITSAMCSQQTVATPAYNTHQKKRNERMNGRHTV